jgi:hypothetical protein
MVKNMPKILLEYEKLHQSAPAILLINCFSFSPFSMASALLLVPLMYLPLRQLLNDHLRKTTNPIGMLSTLCPCEKKHETARLKRYPVAVYIFENNGVKKFRATFDGKFRTDSSNFLFRLGIQYVKANTGKHSCIPVRLNLHCPPLPDTPISTSWVSENWREEVSTFT